MFTLSHTKNLFQRLLLLFKILQMALSAPKTSFDMLVDKKKEVQSGRSKLLILAINGSKISWMAENAPSKFTRRKFKTNSHGSLKFSCMNNFLEFSRWGECFSMLKFLSNVSYGWHYFHRYHCAYGLENWSNKVMHLTPHMAFMNAPLNKKGKVCKKGKTNKHVTSSCNRGF